MPKKVKEMTTTPQSSAGVKKMKMPGAEKKMKLQESEQTLRSVIAKLIKEELKISDSGAEYIEINGKIVKTYTQNKDKSYTVTYNDDSKDVIMVSNDAWKEINTLHTNTNPDLDENYDVDGDLAQLQRDAQSIEPIAQKLAKAFKKMTSDEIAKKLKEKGITDSDIITRVIDLAAKK